MNCRIYLPCLIAGFLLFINTKANAADLYLRLEAPIYTKFHKESKLPSKTKRDITSQYALGFGYELNDYIAAELMFSQLSYSTTYEEATPPRTYSKDEDFLFSPAFPDRGPGRPAFCSRSENYFAKKSEICMDAPLNTASSHVFSKLYSLMLSIRLKPPIEFKIFTPYISTGTGLVVSKSKKIQHVAGNKNNFNDHLLEKNTAKALAFEVGIGMTIKIIDRVMLDVNAKYINYGRHKFASDFTRKIAGYKMAAGVLIII